MMAECERDMMVRRKVKKKWFVLIFLNIIEHIISIFKSWEAKLKDASFRLNPSIIDQVLAK